jgi:hypothetical protein
MMSCRSFSQHLSGQTHRQPINMLRVSPDKRWLAVAGHPHVRLFKNDGQSNGHTHQLEGHTANVTSLQFQSDSQVPSPPLDLSPTRRTDSAPSHPAGCLRVVGGPHGAPPSAESRAQQPSGARACVPRRQPTRPRAPGRAPPRFRPRPGQGVGSPAKQPPRTNWTRLVPLSPNWTRLVPLFRTKVKAWDLRRSNRPVIDLAHRFPVNAVACHPAAPMLVAGDQAHSRSAAAARCAARAARRAAGLPARGPHAGGQRARVGRPELQVSARDGRIAPTRRAGGGGGRRRWRRRRRYPKGRSGFARSQWRRTPRCGCAQN